MKNIVTVAGIEVHVEGSGAETIVMLHGWPDTYRLWDGQVEHLKDRYRCVRFSLPGFEPSRQRHAYTLDQLLALIGRVIEHVAPDQKVILMLHDWGCIFGYEFYMRNPEKVSRIVGVDIGDARSLRKALGPKAMAWVLGYQVWLAVAWMIGGKVGDWMTRAMARAAHCPTPQDQIHSGMTYPYFLQWFGRRRSYRGQLQKFFPTCPMLFVYGTRKPVMFHHPEWLKDLQQVPGNRVVPFDSGHWVMIARPEPFNALVSEWLGENDSLTSKAVAYGVAPGRD